MTAGSRGDWRDWQNQDGNEPDSGYEAEVDLSGQPITGGQLGQTPQLGARLSYDEEAALIEKLRESPSLNQEQRKLAQSWAADDRLWTTQQTVEINLGTFARCILKAADGRATDEQIQDFAQTIRELFETLRDAPVWEKLDRELYEAWVETMQGSAADMLERMPQKVK